MTDLILPQRVLDIVQNDPPAEVLGTARTLETDDLLLIRFSGANRQTERRRVAEIQKAVKKASPGWRGQVLHLPPDLELAQLPAPMVEALYEALLARFDPDLYETRAERRKAAEEQAERAEAEAEAERANAIADHLETLQS